MNTKLTAQIVEKLKGQFEAARGAGKTQLQAVEQMNYKLTAQVQELQDQLVELEAMNVSEAENHLKKAKELNTSLQHKKDRNKTKRDELKKEICTNAEKHQSELNEISKKTKADMQQQRREYIEELESMAQDQVATQYVNDILNHGLESVLSQAYDNLRTVREAHDNLQKERDSEMLDRARN